MKTVSTPVTSGLGVQSIVTGAEKGKHAHPSTHWPRARPVNKSIGSTRATKNLAIDSILEACAYVSLLCVECAQPLLGGGAC